MKSRQFFCFLFAIITIFVLTACSGGGGSSGGIGTLSLSLTDASSSDYKAVVVTIDEIQVHLKGDGNSPNHWKSVDMPISPLTVNLLDLVNGVREDLGLVDLKARSYTQMRLIIGDTPNPAILPFANYVVTNTDPVEIHELKIPSGDKTGFKIVNGFTIAADQKTELILDFDACRSVVQAGDSGQWLLKPTVKVRNTANYAIIEGRVTDDTPSAMGINGVLVTVQKNDGTAIDPKNKVVVVAATLTDFLKTEAGDEILDTEGNFSIFVEPLTNGEHYYLVAYKDGYIPDFLKITELAAGQTRLVDDLILSEDGSGTVAGLVTINGADNTEQYATLSFRQEVGVDDEMIEIKSINVLNTYRYSVNLPSVDLPEELYTLVASTLFGFETEEYTSLTVETGVTTTQNVELTTPEEKVLF
jgi:hypothetical protein